MKEKKGSAKKGPMGHGPMSKMEKPQDMKKALKGILQYLKPYAWKFVIVFLFAMGSTIFAIRAPKVLGEAINEIANGFIKMTVYDTVTSNLPDNVVLPEGTTGETILNMIPAEQLEKLPETSIEAIKEIKDFSTRPTMDYSAIFNIVLSLGFLYVLSALFNYIQSFIVTEVSQRITYKLRRDMFAKINRMPLKYFDNQNHGEVLSIMTNDIDTVGSTIGQSLSQSVIIVTTLIGILIMMFSINLWMTFIALLILPVALILIRFVVKFSQQQFVNQQKYLGEVNGHIEEMYSGHTIVKAFNGEERSIKQFNQINEKLYGSGWKSQFISGLMMPIINFVGNLGYVAISVLGGYLVIDGKIGIGDIQSFIQYVRQFTQNTAQSAAIINNLQSTLAAAERVLNFLQEPEEAKDAKNAKVLDTVKGNVEFQHVKFGYQEDNIIIKDFNVKVKQGQTVAIVGPTGAGKTTLVKLLMRFYDVNDGKILIDNIDIRDMKRQNLRSQFGMVLQDTWLFHGTIKDNIKYGNKNATDEEVRDAMKRARVSHFVDTLPNNVDFILNEEGSNISGGQKQLLTIARAFLTDPKILILDEATSSVDTRTEVLIQSAMDELMKNRTSFIIAHRLSTIKNADLILVMKDGDIVEHGTHQELLLKNGFYASLYNSQFETE